jgi:hypothetical protein
MHASSQGVLKTTKLDKTARPILAYMDNQLDSDVCCSVVTNNESQGKELVVKILDSGVKANFRGAYPVAIIRRLDPEKLPSNFYEGVQIVSSLGSFSVGATPSEGGKRLMRKLWSRTVPDLLAILIAAETEYCKNNFAKTKPWLSTLNKEQRHRMKKHLAQQIGQKVHSSWE